MKIYTRTGDLGDTGLFGGPRVSKDAPRIEAYGTVDELNSVLGLVRTESLPAALDTVLTRVQNELFDLGAELASPDPARQGTGVVGMREVSELEQAIDRMEGDLPPLKQFVLPGGCRGGAYLHIARTVCRRAERRVVSLSQVEGERVAPHLVIYLNRLSDFLFVAARWVNLRAGVADVPWQHADAR